MSTNEKLIPDHRPRIDSDQIEEVLADMLSKDTKVNRAVMEARMAVGPIIVGSRGYFPNSLGRKGVNDLGFFDDGLFVRVPPMLATTARYHTFNANVDPVRAGWNKDVHKLMAQLDADQIVVFRQGRHRKIQNRLRQLTDEEAADAMLDNLFIDEADPRRDGEFRVQRITADGVGEFETGCFNINIHGASERSTGSWGCQTLPVEQEKEFFGLVYRLMEMSGLGWRPYTRTGGFDVIPYFFTDRKLK